MSQIPFTDEELKQPIADIINKKISPMLAKDGGAMKLLDIKKQKVYIQLQGACIGCASSATTLEFIVKKEIKAMIHPDIVIINVPVGMEDKLDQLDG
jgi:Fe-S cluster biogenesis protein NfuA